MTTTDSPAAGPDAPSPATRPRRRVREGALILASLALVGVAIAAGTRGAGSTARLTPKPTSSVAGFSVADLHRKHAISRLLAARAAAIRHRDRAAFAATLDPRSRAFRRRQLAVFKNLTELSFSHWSYRFSATSTPLPARVARRYAAPTFVPNSFLERYTIAGFDPEPTVLTEHPTFVERAGRWYLASLSDDRGILGPSDRQIWDYGPLAVVRRPRVLVLGPPAERGVLEAIAAQTTAAIPRVTAVWGPHWARRAVVQLPASLQEMATITSDHDDLHRIAALASSESSAGGDGYGPIGDRVTLNPDLWARTSALGASVILSHELTHIATRSDTGPATPKWLSEGFADYVGYRDVGLAPSELAAELARRVQAGFVPRQLPPSRFFRGRNPRIATEYQEGWLACRYIDGKYGEQRLVRFYRAVGDSSSPQPEAIAHAMGSVLHTTPGRFVADWRRYVKQQV